MNAATTGSRRRAAGPGWQLGPLTVDRPVVRVPGLPSRLSILHLSDLHFSPGDGPLLDELAAVLAGLPGRPDLVTIAGDFINEDAGLPLVERFLRLLPEGPPKVAVLGNHDFFRVPPLQALLALVSNASVFRVRRPMDTPRLREILRTGGVDLLEHAGRTFRPAGLAVHVTGLRQPEPRREHEAGPDVPTTPEATLRILLAHRPDVDQAYASRHHLFLGGHTHGGQVRLPLLGTIRSNCRVPPRACAGHFRLGSCQWHVNNGFSSFDLVRLRLGVPRQVSWLSVEPGEPPPLPELRLLPPYPAP